MKKVYFFDDDFFDAREALVVLQKSRAAGELESGHLPEVILHIILHALFGNIFFPNFFSQFRNLFFGFTRYLQRQFI